MTDCSVVETGGGFEGRFFTDSHWPKLQTNKHTKSLMCNYGGHSTIFTHAFFCELKHKNADPRRGEEIDVCN